MTGSIINATGMASDMKLIPLHWKMIYCVLFSRSLPTHPSTAGSILISPNRRLLTGGCKYQRNCNGYGIHYCLSLSESQYLLAGCAVDRNNRKNTKPEIFLYSSVAVLPTSRSTAAAKSAAATTEETAATAKSATTAVEAVSVRNKRQNNKYNNTNKGKYCAIFIPRLFS